MVSEETELPEEGPGHRQPPGLLDADEEPRLLQSFRWHGEAPSSFTTCTFVPVRRQVAVGTQEGTVLVWPVEAQERSRPTKLSGGQPCSAVTGVASSDEGDLVGASFVDGTVRFWRNQAGRQAPTTLKMHFGPARACDFSARGAQLLLSCSDDKLVKLTSVRERRFVGSLVGHSNWVRSAVFARNADLVASGADDKTVRLWDVERRSVVRIWHDHGSSVTCVRFDTTGSTIAGCSSDSTINLWDVRSHALRQHYARAHGSSSITQIDIHPSEDLMLSASSDRTLRLWDLRAGRLRFTVRGHERRPGVYACAWDDRGSSFASCDNQLVHVWSLTRAVVNAAPEEKLTKCSTTSRSQRRSFSLDACTRGAMMGSSVRLEHELVPPRRSSVAGDTTPAVDEALKYARGESSLAQGRPAIAEAWQPHKPATNEARGREGSLHVVSGHEAPQRDERINNKTCETMLFSQAMRGSESGGFVADTSLPCTTVSGGGAQAGHINVTTGCGNGAQMHVSAGVGGPQEHVEEAVARALEQMVSQMDMITRSLQSIESRIQNTDETLAELTTIAKSRLPLQRVDRQQ
eukprot:TRINITY_DN43978_c0_g1_i1.p1 TRINITY_DN43978_c0_g1~~TRINITY_DN43978_c0_g1_i1.p1  ORF type:complete len:576 (-),score=74.07 TRINITY_DN43978_c0_g1_i1:199-1926(-)